MKALVTGGAGFIGSHLCERLLHDGHSVAIVDTFNDFYSPSIKEANIKNCITDKKCTVYRVDIRDKKELDAVFAKERPDVVFHLAAMAGVRPSIQNPALYYDVNVMGTVNVLESCKMHHVKKIIFASSSSVYGNNKKVPFNEADAVDNPISPYAASKKAGELLCHTYSHLYGLSVICLRFFTVYGPKQRPDLAIIKFIKSISGNKEIELYGDGTTSRDYTFVSDIIDGVVAAVSLNSLFEIINLGDSNPVSLKNLVSDIESAVGKKALIKHLPMQQGDVERTYADITKAKRLLDYEPHVKIEDGIKKTVIWFKEQNK